MVRIWSGVPVRELANQWLLGEHRELHVIVGAAVKHWNRKKGGWVNHPETKRFYGHLGYLKKRHDEQIKEFRKRGWPSGEKHLTPLDFSKAPRKAMGTRPKITRAMRQKDISDLKKRGGFRK